MAEEAAGPISRPIRAVPIVLRGEAVLILACAVAAYAKVGASWLLFAALFFAPDLTMLGYLVDTRVGAAVYNVGHTYLSPGLLACAGWALGFPPCVPLALIWTAHIGFDRALSFGLKYPSAFSDTHLGRV